MPAETLQFRAALDNNPFIRGLRDMEAQAAKGAKVMGGAFTSLATGPVAAFGAAIAGAFAGRAVADGVADIFKAGQSLQVMARQTVASTEGLARLGAAFQTAGLGSDAVARSIFRLQKSIAGVEDEENKGGSAAIERLGLNLAALQQMAPDKELLAVGTAISKIHDNAERSATAMKIFGKTGAELGALFNGHAFGEITPNMAINARILARNSALFEQASIRLNRAGDLFKSFYLGTASGLVKELTPMLDQIERVNLVAVGAKFGVELSDAAKIFIGAFQVPETAYTLIENGLAYSFTSAGNVLLASLKTAAEFFQTGMFSAVQGVGSAIVATLMQSFDKPIRYFQAALESTLSIQKNIADTKAGKKTDFERFGEMTPAALQQRIDQLRHLIEHPSKNTTLDQQGFFRSQLDRAREYQTHPNHFVQPFETTEEVLERHKNDPTRFGLYNGGQTAAEWGQEARDNMQDSFSAAKAAAGHFQVEDVLGARHFQEESLVASAKLRQRGAAFLGTDRPKPAGGLSDAAGAALLTQAHMALMNSHATPGADPSAYMFLGHTGMPGTKWMNASDPYTARVDAMRRAMMFSQHTIGIGGALDGRDTSLRTGGLGGGAYGQTGNIWRQGGGNRPGEIEARKAREATNRGATSADVGKTNELLGQIQQLQSQNLALQKQIWGGSGGSSSGGGGATVTGK